MKKTDPNADQRHGGKKTPKQDELPGMNRTEPKPDPPPKTPEELRDAGMKRAADHAGADWQAQARDVIYLCAKKHRYFFYDTYQSAAELMNLPKPPDGRAWGTVLRTAARSGWIRKTGEWTKSRRPICHGADKPVYRSLIHPKAEKAG